MGYPFHKTTTFRQLWKHQKQSCFFCGVVINPEPYERKVNPFGCTRDHFLPKVAGHTNKGNNVISCHSCNSRKSCAPPTYLECVRFVDIWAKLHQPISPVWHEFIEELRFIRWFSNFFNLPAP